IAACGLELGDCGTNPLDAPRNLRLRSRERAATNCRRQNATAWAMAAHSLCVLGPAESIGPFTHARIPARFNLKFVLPVRTLPRPPVHYVATSTSSSAPGRTARAPSPSAGISLAPISPASMKRHRVQLAVKRTAPLQVFAFVRTVAAWVSASTQPLPAIQAAAE